MIRVAFDCDDTIYKVVKSVCPVDCSLRHREHEHLHQVPDYDIIQVLRWFVNNGDKVFVWSAGGVSYAQDIVDKLGLTDIVEVIPKISSAGQLKKRHEGIDIAFDDCETLLGKVDVRVRREWIEPVVPD